MQDLKSIYLLRDIDLGICTLKKGSIVFMCDTGLKTFFKTDSLEISVENSKLKESVGKEPFFVYKDELDECINYGSTLKILSRLGVQEYTVEGIEFQNDAYVTLSLKIS